MGFGDIQDPGYFLHFRRSLRECFAGPFGRRSLPGGLAFTAVANEIAVAFADMTQILGGLDNADTTGGMVFVYSIGTGTV